MNPRFTPSLALALAAALATFLVLTGADHIASHAVQEIGR